MNNQQSFLEFSITPEVEKEKKKNQEYYIQNGDSFLWKTHTNGGAEWSHKSELTINGGKKKPLRYKTYNGAKRMGFCYISQPEIAVWND